MHPVQSGLSVGTEAGKLPRASQRSKTSSRLKVSASAAFRSRGARGFSSVHTKQQQQHSQHQQVVTTILQRRERLRVYEDGEDVTPRNLVHPLYTVLDDRRTAFDSIGLIQQSSSGIISHLTTQQPRLSLATVSSFSSIYTTDDSLALKRSESAISSAKGSLQGSVKALDVVEDDEEAPSQYHLPRFDLKEFSSFNERVTLTLRETETFFLFELPQLTEDARTPEGQLIVEANELYKQKTSGPGRKIVDAETQTPQLYTKTRGTYIGRRERKNHATFVNNWVMYDTYQNDAQAVTEEPCEECRFKFPKLKSDILGREPEEQLAKIGASKAYEDAARVMLRILASKRYEEAQKKFAGLLRQDPCDPDLQLVYGLELLWRHTSPLAQHRPASAMKWNPVNRSLLAVGYRNITKSHSNEEIAEGLVLIWCAKNPSEPDRTYEFNSAVSALDWSITKPNLLALGFYDGVVRIIDVSKKELTIIRQSERKTSPSYGPHWQVQWWLIRNESFDSEHQYEQVYTSNQDGRISYYSVDEDFAPHEILRLQRIEGKNPGVRRVNHCLGHEIPISRNPGGIILRRHPKNSDIYMVGTDEGCVYRCALSHPHSHLESLLAHDGPIYSFEFSPFCSKLMLTCGGDWTARIWAEGVDEPLLTFGTKMSFVRAATWSPKDSTIFASAVNNEVCIWDLKRKTHRPASITRVATQGARLLRLDFTSSGDQLVATDDYGVVHVHGLVGMPLPALDQNQALIQAIEQALVTKPELLRKLKKFSTLFDDS